MPVQAGSWARTEQAGSLPACQLGGVVGRLPPTPQVLFHQPLASLKLGQPASLPPGLGRALPWGRFATCLFSPAGCKPAPQQTAQRAPARSKPPPFVTTFLVPAQTPGSG